MSRIWGALLYGFYSFYSVTVLSITTGIVFTLTFLVPKSNLPLALRVRCVCAKLLLTLWAITKAVVSFMLPWLGQLGYIMLWGALFAVKYVSGSSSVTIEQVLKWRLVVSAVASDVRLLVVLPE